MDGKEKGERGRGEQTIASETGTGNVKKVSEEHNYFRTTVHHGR